VRVSRISHGSSISVNEFARRSLRSNLSGLKDVKRRIYFEKPNLLNAGMNLIEFIYF
jgi:hypothetical protein